MIAQLAANPWWWLVLAVLLGIAEIVTPGVFLIFIAAAAALTGALAIVLPLPVEIQFLLFALFSLLSVALGRRWYASDATVSKDPLLNDRVARMIGETATIAEPIVHGRGRARVGDSVWDCAGPDLDAGVTVRITGARGSVLQVERI